MMNTKLKDLSLLEASDFLKAPDSLDTSDNESFDVMGESRNHRIGQLSRFSICAVSLEANKISPCDPLNLQTQAREGRYAA